MKETFSILITGATGGIGSALAKAYAKENTTLVLQGRKPELLQALDIECTTLGARVITKVIDLRERELFSTWLSQVSKQEAFDLVIVNAGININIGENKEGESWEEAQALIDINVLAAMATVNAVLPSMRQRRKGQIALMSSLAAYYGLPITPSYCASKAAIKAYGESLRGWLRAEGIRVNVVMPGYVESQMCTDMPGPKPFLWTADKAARTIKKRLECNQARISFPFPLNFGTWFLAAMPAKASEWVLRKLNYAG